ncbi:formylglycine-generating enzyme family protein [Caenimonas koreensis]|uniref:SUMF1/EgtB/PvdO family nonheme iron enzyme n=1 Tax=Caenimonas koreensis DSM 17982 TaxID=1121255 RepID=A0A844B2M6_9BURK|nr:formylglycine-generating enzyme family protein [Caenimonas koreensis]MRD48998.1 SUMF1/EgtB/PvdO family nonheme iron enzyme [Caenimonas koreensis DSM 17982]
MKALATIVTVLAVQLATPAIAATYVPVPGGTFESVLPQGLAPTVSTPVEITSFAMRSTPVTVAQYEAFVRAYPQWQKGEVPATLAERRYLASWKSATAAAGPAGDAAAPVTDVSWFAARAFCESEGARLPTWLEWEYAAAADATRTDARRDPAWRQRILSWYSQPTGDTPGRVGGEPNVYGVRDMHGLVWEWVDDFNALFIAGDSRTQGDADLLKFCGAGAINIIDKDSYAVVMRIALLSSLNAADTTASLGFRCVRDAGTTP